MGNKLVCNVEGLSSLIYKSTMNMVSQIAERPRYSWAAPVGLKQHSQALPHEVKSPNEPNLKLCDVCIIFRLHHFIPGTSLAQFSWKSGSTSVSAQHFALLMVLHVA